MISSNDHFVSVLLTKVRTTMTVKFPPPRSELFRINSNFGPLASERVLLSTWSVMQVIVEITPGSGINFKVAPGNS